MTLIQRPNKSPEPATLDHYRDRTGRIPLVRCNIFRGHADNEMNLDSARGFHRTILDWPVNSASSWVCSQTGRKERGGGDTLRRVSSMMREGRSAKRPVDLLSSALGQTRYLPLCWLCFLTEGGQHFGKVFCHERTRVLRRLRRLNVVLSSSTGSGSLFPTWWSECVNSGASQIHTTDCAQSVYYVKRALDKK